MGDTNYFSGVVKILENPRERFINKTTPFLIFRAEVPQRKKNCIISILFWGNLANEAKKYYRKNDYILIEGYLSTRDKPNSTPNVRKAKQILITVLRVYPIFLNSTVVDNRNSND